MSVYIDNDFARFGDKSYAINKINSVEIREEKPKTGGCAIVLGVIAALFVLGAIGAGSGSGSGETGGSSGVAFSLSVAIVFGALAFALWKLGKRRTYQLFLMTSSSEAQAFTTKNRDEVYSLREQIETAMQHHSRKGTPD